MVNLQGHPKKLRVSYITFITFTSSSGGKGSGRGVFSRHWLCGSNEEQLTCQTEGLARVTREQYKLVMWLAPGMANTGSLENTLIVKRCRPHRCYQTGCKLNISNSFLKVVVLLNIFRLSCFFYSQCIFFFRLFAGGIVAAVCRSEDGALRIKRPVWKYDDGGLM